MGVGIFLQLKPTLGRSRHKTEISDILISRLMPNRLKNASKLRLITLLTQPLHTLPMFFVFVTILKIS